MHNSVVLDTVRRAFLHYSHRVNKALENELSWVPLRHPSWFDLAYLPNYGFRVELGLRTPDGGCLTYVDRQHDADIEQFCALVRLKQPNRMSYEARWAWGHGPMMEVPEDREDLFPVRAYAPLREDLVRWLDEQWPNREEILHEAHWARIQLEQAQLRALWDSRSGIEDFPGEPDYLGDAVSAESPAPEANP